MITVEQVYNLWLCGMLIALGRAQCVCLLRAPGFASYRVVLVAYWSCVQRNVARMVWLSIGVCSGDPEDAPPVAAISSSGLEYVYRCSSRYFRDVSALVLVFPLEMNETYLHRRWIEPSSRLPSLAVAWVGRATRAAAVGVD